MAVRFRKYYKDCRDISCNGKRSKQCPNRPKRSNGKYATCGAWCVEYRELDGCWVSKIFSGISKTQAVEFYEEIKARIRRGVVGIPQIKT